MADSLTKADLGNLANLVARATYNGIQEASAGIVLFTKLQALANAVEEPKVGSDDTKGSA